tara:strand:+ start:9145 stop:9546 length:402 start_codon:yes stop_codon:yes gene_type:complete
VVQVQETVETDITFVISDINNRVRTLENRYNLFGERLLVVNQNMIEEYKKLTKEMRLINDDLKEMKQDMFKVRDVITNVVKEMEGFAKRDQIKVLEKYIDLWSPLNLVTRTEVRKLIVEEMTNKKLSVKRGNK